MIDHPAASRRRLGPPLPPPAPGQHPRSPVGGVQADKPARIIIGGPEPLTREAVAAILVNMASHHVDVIVIGGVAAWAHGGEPTFNVDLLVDQETTNLERAARALRDLGANEDWCYQPTAARLAGVITDWRTRHGNVRLFHAVAHRSGIDRGYRHLLGVYTDPCRYGDAVVPTLTVQGLTDTKGLTGRPRDRRILHELADRSSPTPLRPAPSPIAPSTGFGR